MEARFLKEACDLLKTYTTYDSYEALAKRLGIAARTLTGYWENDKGVASIPDKNVSKFINLLQEVIGTPLSEESAELLLTSHPIALHNRLMPFSNVAWARLIQKHEQAEPLEITIHPREDLSFGETDDAPFKPQATAAMFQPYSFATKAAWPGEVFLIGERQGEWRLIDLRPGERTMRIDHGEVVVPPPIDGRRRSFREKGRPGFYRYVLVGQKGKFDADLRRDLQQANPLSQLALDLIGDRILALPKPARLVRAALLQIED
jgi:hypothetical protein